MTDPQILDDGVAQLQNFLLKKKKYQNQKKVGDDQTTNLVCFGMGEETFGFELLKLREILKVEAVAPVPGGAAHLTGFINLRGEFVAVVNMHVFLGFPSVDTTKQSRILIVEHQAHLIGFLVDQVKAIKSIADKAIQPSVKSPENNKKYIQGIGNIEGSLVALLDLDKIYLALEQKK